MSGMLCRQCVPQSTSRGLVWSQALHSEKHVRCRKPPCMFWLPGNGMGTGPGVLVACNRPCCLNLVKEPL